MRVLCGVLCVVNVNSEQGSRLVDRSAIRMRHWRQGSGKAPMIVMVSTGTNGRILLFGCRKLPIDQPSESTYCDTILPKGYIAISQTIVEASGLAWRWMCDSPRTGCARRITPTYLWREQAIIEWSRPVISIVACCHSVKLCALAARAFRPQHHENQRIIRKSSNKHQMTNINSLILSAEANSIRQWVPKCTSWNKLPTLMLRTLDTWRKLALTFLCNLKKINQWQSIYFTASWCFVASLNLSDFSVTERNVFEMTEKKFVISVGMSEYIG